MPMDNTKSTIKISVIKYLEANHGKNWCWAGTISRAIHEETGHKESVIERHGLRKLREEGIAREIVNRIQNLRKENKFEVTDRIEVRVKNHPKINSAILNNLDYIRAEILANTFEIVNEINGNGVEIEVNDEIKTMVVIDRIKQLN